MKATEVTAGPSESNGSLLPGLWRDSLHVTCGLTTCTPGSAPGPTLGNEYGKNFTFYPEQLPRFHAMFTKFSGMIALGVVYLRTKYQPLAPRGDDVCGTATVYQLGISLTPTDLAKMLNSRLESLY